MSLPEFEWPEAFRQRVDAFRGSKVMLRAGRELLDEGTYRFRGFEPVAIDLFENWTANPVANRSWQWHSASFNFMPWLIAVHGDGGDQRAIDHAARAIESWHRRFVLADSGYEFAWHDHATANRVINVLSLLCHLDESPARLDVDGMLRAFLQAHGDKLRLEEMYSKYTNHGIDQSRVLLLLATCAPWLEGARDWKRVALERLEGELGHAFLADGAHIENSPGYHQFVSSIFTDVLRTFGTALDTAFRERVQATLDAAAQYMAWVVRPDGRFPPIGDTECKVASNVYATLSGTRAHRNLQWVVSKGREGEKPRGWSRAFRKSGYFFARSDWDQGATPGDAFHLVLRSGHSSDYHRHDDDLSLTLWWGTDWFVDGGAYSYAEQDPVRRYLRSKWGHNVVVVDDGAKEWTRPGAGAPGTLATQKNGPGRVVATATTQSYPGMAAKRELHVARDTRTFRVEDVLSPLGRQVGSRRFLSLWHVPDDKSISIEGQTVRISDANFLRDVVIRNLGEDFDHIHVMDAFPNGDIPVWSKELNKVQSCKVIAFERTRGRLESRLEFHLEDRRPPHRSPGDRHAAPRGLFRSYCLDPKGWWPQQGHHHARRIAARITHAGRDEASAWDREARIEELFSMAVVRKGHRKPTLYLANMGYPDATLLGLRLRAAVGMLHAGEVYLPTSVQEVIAGWPDEERLLFVDAVHLLHAAAKPGSHILNSVVNSSQSQYQDVFWRKDGSAVRALATREPVDAALNALARSRPASGWESRGQAEAALERQVKRLTRFARWTRQQFSIAFRIEDVAVDPEPVFTKLAQLCRMPLDMDELARLPATEPLAADQTDAELLALHGIPARAMLQGQLSEARVALGYP